MKREIMRLQIRIINIPLFDIIDKESVLLYNRMDNVFYPPFFVKVKSIRGHIYQLQFFINGVDLYSELNYELISFVALLILQLISTPIMYLQIRKRMCLI